MGYRVAKQAKRSRSASALAPHQVQAPAGDHRGEDRQFSVVGIEKEAVGQVAADIRRFRRPSPTRQGVMYRGEKIRRKAVRPQGRQTQHDRTIDRKQAARSGAACG